MTLPTNKPRKLPIALKLVYSAFMAVLTPVYWHYYGPTNFLYFCDVALILTFFGIWLENAMLVSMCAVGILLPQTLWVADFLSNFLGHPIVGMTNYMFQADHSLFLRSLSLFHGWIPFLLVFLVWRLGYERRAVFAWTALAWALVLICFFFMPPPNPNAGLIPVNINYVWGMKDEVAQTWMSSTAWLFSLLAGLPLLLFLPTHLILKKFMPRAGN